MCGVRKEDSVVTPRAGNSFSEEGHKMFSTILNICTIIGAVVGVAAFVLYLFDR